MIDATTVRMWKCLLSFLQCALQAQYKSDWLYKKQLRLAEPSEC